MDDPLDIPPMLRKALETKFYYIQTTSNFSSWTEFSDTRFRLSKCFDGYGRYTELVDLIDVKKCCGIYPGKLKQALDIKWIYPAQKKVDRVVNIAVLFTRLCDEVALDKEYEKERSRFSVGHIGLGSPETWHGSADMSVKCSSSSLDINVVVEEEIEEEVDSEGDSVLNTTMKEKVLSQVVATTVVASFTNHGILPDVTITPVLLLCKQRVSVCLYDCTSDILLCSEPLPLFSEDKVNENGLTLIWIILNYRYVPLVI